MRYQIPVVFMNKTNISKVHNEMKFMWKGEEKGR